MRKIIFALFLGLPLTVHGQNADDPLSQKTHDALVEIIQKVVANPAMARYLGQVNAKEIKPVFNSRGGSHDDAKPSWIWTWQFAKGVKYTNPLGAQQPMPVVESDTGVLFSVFIATGHGDDMISRQTNVTLSKTPDLHVGYLLMTKLDTGYQREGEKLPPEAAEFRKKLTEIIAQTVADIQKKTSF